MKRSEALEEIITFGTERSQAILEISSFDFDSEIEYYIVSEIIFAKVLKKYLQNEISETDLETWANFIEGRDDVNYVKVADHINMLANPILSQSISKTNISNILSSLSVT